MLLFTEETGATQVGLRLLLMWGPGQCNGASCDRWRCSDRKPEFTGGSARRPEEQVEAPRILELAGGGARRPSDTAAQPPRMDPAEPPGWRPGRWAWVTGSKDSAPSWILTKRTQFLGLQVSQDMKHFFPPNLRFIEDLSPSRNVQTQAAVPRGGVGQGWKAAPRSVDNGLPGEWARAAVELLESECGAHGWSLPPTDGLAFAMLSRHVSPADQRARVPACGGCCKDTTWVGRRGPGLGTVHAV